MLQRNLRTQNNHSEIKSQKSWFVLRMIAFVSFILLLTANVMTFAGTVKISDNIVNLESKTQELRKENSQLEERLYSQNSLTNLQDLADQLGFTKSAEPLFLDSNDYALLP